MTENEERELDEQVAMLVMGWPDNGLGRWINEGESRFEPSTDIRCAWMVVGRLYEKRMSVTMRSCESGRWYCRFDENRGVGLSFSANEPTAPLAICKAALLSVTARKVAT